MKKNLIAFKNWLWERKDISIPNSYVNEYLSERKPSIYERFCNWWDHLIWGV